MSARPGAEFAKLWTASAVSNVGDGVTVVAGPLLAASLTRDPAQVALVAFAQALPWPLFSLVSGAVVDRVDRRRLICAVDLLRGAVLAGLALLVAAGAATVPLLCAVFFLVGLGETVADTAAVARLPAIVPPERLAAANARLMATFTVGNQLAAKPLGAWLFAAGAAFPFGFDAVTFVVAALLVASMRRVPAETRGRPPGDRRSLRADIAEGVRWLWSHRLLRTLALSMGVANIAFCSAFSVFVLYAADRLGLSEVGYGLLLTTFGFGGLAGTVLADRLQRRFGATALLRAGLALEAATHLVLASTRHAWVAAAILVAFGVHTMVWGVIATTVRQRATPDRLLGRVGGVYALADSSGAALGLLTGGVLARAGGVTAPYWIAGALTALVTAAAWRPLKEASRL
ncbi:MFS transporter [Actinomadura terrae]|uniref:MFS transporter n=1 Tax=Actinomadura terrae TaxID=604353 RepID=UPI001FA7D729|nr:MFS transporter [Actinomadura terrae]